MATTNVTLTLDGLVVLAATEGQPTGQVGVLDFDGLGHNLQLTVIKKRPNGDVRVPVPHVAKDLSLHIEPAQNITIRDKTAVHRNDAVTHEQSYKWFVDLEDGNEFYNFPIGADPNGFKSILKFNGGELYTALPPNNSMLDATNPHGPHRVGRVALVLGIDFRSATRAIFTNGNDVLFDSTTDPAGTNYEIHLSHNTEQHGSVSVDANFYYLALGSKIPVEKVIFFSSTASILQQLTDRVEHAKAEGHEHAADDKIQKLIEKLRAQGSASAGPEAACFPAYLSQTKLTDS